MPNRNPPIIQELNRQLLKLQRYLYNFWIRNIKKLAFKQNLPVEFFRQKYENEVKIAIHKFIEQVYLKTIEQLQKKLLLKQKQEQQREKEAPTTPPTTQPTTTSSNLLTSLVDITNINQIATDTTNQYFNSLGRIIDRASWSLKITTLETIHQLMLFAEMAAFQRVANYAAYNTFNTAIQSKLLQVNDENTQLRYVTAKDEKVCPICLPFDGKIYQSTFSLDIPDLPQHPNCRCFLEVII